MTPEPPDEPERDYEHDFILHAPMVFDMAADAGWIDFTLRYNPASPPQDPAQHVADVVHALGQFDRSLGGHGLTVDRERSTNADDRLALVLWPIKVTGAAERFRAMAEASAARWRMAQCNSQLCPPTAGCPK